MDKREFLYNLRRWQKGSISRRHFLGVTGLGAASLVLARELGIDPLGRRACHFRTQPLHPAGNSCLSTKRFDHLACLVVRRRIHHDQLGR